VGHFTLFSSDFDEIWYTAAHLYTTLLAKWEQYKNNKQLYSMTVTWPNMIILTIKDDRRPPYLKSFLAITQQPII